MEGFFVAGDVTDVEEKQISVAVGQGAVAALSAYTYLVDNKLVKPKMNLKTGNNKGTFGHHKTIPPNI